MGGIYRTCTYEPALVEEWFASDVKSENDERSVQVRAHNRSRRLSTGNYSGHSLKYKFTVKYIKPCLKLAIIKNIQQIPSAGMFQCVPATIL